jgi:hypothetical protein
MNAFARTGLVAAMVVAGLVTTVAPAMAADASDTVPGLKTALTQRIDLRLTALAKDGAAITAAKHLTDADKSTLSTLVSKDTSGLNDLKTKVASETTLAALKADAQSMVDDYRVFILVGPQVRLTVAGDAEAFALDKVQQAHDKLATLVAKAKAAGKDTTSAEQDLTDMQAAIDKGKADLAGQVTKVLALVPGPDGAALKTQVLAVRTALGTTRVDLRTAATKGRAVVAFLKSAK